MIASGKWNKYHGSTFYKNFVETNRKEKKKKNNNIGEEMKKKPRKPDTSKINIGTNEG